MELVPLRAAANVVVVIPDENTFLWTEGILKKECSRHSGKTGVDDDEIVRPACIDIDLRKPQVGTVARSVRDFE